MNNNKKPTVVTDARLFDLVRYARQFLHDEGLITDDEYFWLCAEAPLAQGNGSPSPRRLERYDEMRATITDLEYQVKTLRKGGADHE